MFRKDRIFELVEDQRAKEEAGIGQTVYDDVPEDFWIARREKPATEPK